MTGRPRLSLTADEKKTLAAITETKFVTSQWTALKKLQVRSDSARLQLGRSLMSVHNKLATKPGNTKGLFYKWLTVIGLNHQSAYDYMAKADPKRFRNGYSSPSRQKRVQINALLVALNNADSDVQKRAAFRAVCAFIRKAYGVR